MEDFFLGKAKKEVKPRKKNHKYLVKNQKIGESLCTSIWVLIETREVGRGFERKRLGLLMIHHTIYVV